jgi:hypothetical protein
VPPFSCRFHFPGETGENRDRLPPNNFQGLVDALTHDGAYGVALVGPESAPCVTWSS